jgi:hypothetical protein
MPMLNDETLKEVGRFAVEFSTLDELITTLATAILECAEPNTAQYLTKQLLPGRKLEQIKEVSNILAEAHRLKGADVHIVMLKQIELANGIVNERNAVIHGKVRMQGNRPIIEGKKQAVELSPGALSGLVKKIDRVAYDLISAYVEFMDAVYKARNAGG